MKEHTIKPHKNPLIKHTIVLVTINILLLFLIIVSVYYISRYYANPVKTHMTYTTQKGGDQ